MNVLLMSVLYWDNCGSERYIFSDVSIRLESLFLKPKYLSISSTRNKCASAGLWHVCIAFTFQTQGCIHFLYSLAQYVLQYVNKMQYSQPQMCWICAGGLLLVQEAVTTLCSSVVPGCVVSHHRSWSGNLYIIKVRAFLWFEPDDNPFSVGIVTGLCLLFTDSWACLFSVIIQPLVLYPRPCHYTSIHQAIHPIHLSRATLR